MLTKMNKFKPDNQELWDLCMKHGSIIARREKVTQSAILDMYDEINQLQNKSSNTDYIKKPSALEYRRICTNEKINPIVADLIYHLFFI